MPDSSGKLSDAERTEIENFFQKRFGRLPICPTCGHQHWHVGEHIVAPINVNMTFNYVFQGMVYPSVVLICTSCGFTQNYNATVIGIIPRPKAPISDGSNG